MAKKPRKTRPNTIRKYKSIIEYASRPETDPSYEWLAHVHGVSKSTVSKAFEYKGRKYREKTGKKKSSNRRGYNLKKDQYDGEIGRIVSKRSHKK